MAVVSPSSFQLHQPLDLVFFGKFGASVENDERRPGPDQSSRMADSRSLRNRCRSHLDSRGDLDGRETKNDVERCSYPMGMVRLGLVVPGGFVGVALDCRWNIGAFKPVGAVVGYASVLAGGLPGWLDDDLADTGCERSVGSIDSRSKPQGGQFSLALAGLRIVRRYFYNDELEALL